MNLIVVFIYAKLLYLYSLLLVIKFASVINLKYHLSVIFEFVIAISQKILAAC